jgi:hypothetical protein
MADVDKFDGEELPVIISTRSSLEEIEEPWDFRSSEVPPPLTL